MSQLIQHYQTSFTVKGGNPDIDKMYQAQFLIGEWIKGHEIKRFKAHQRDPKSSFVIDYNFKRRCGYKSNFSWCKTDYCIEYNAIAWAVKYRHRDAEVKDVYWVSEIGLHYFSDTKELVVSVCISYEVSTAFALSGKSFKPDVSIPWCVAGLFETFDECRFFSGEADVTDTIKVAQKINSIEKAVEIHRYMQSDERKLAVVLLVGDSKEVRKEADFLSKNLFGKALVFIMPYNHVIMREFSELHLQFNECIFVPTRKAYRRENIDTLRYLADNTKSNKENHRAILKGWLGCQQIFEYGAVSDLDDVRFLIRRQMYLKLAEDLKGRVPAEDYEKVKAELQDVSGLFSLAEEENKELVNRVGELEDRTVTLEIEKETLKDEHAAAIHNIKATQESLLLKNNEDFKALPRAYPNSFEALRKFAPFFQHLVFSDNAWEPALAYRQFKDFDVAWEMLHDLDQKMWNIIFVTRGDIEREFESSTTYEYARGEGRQTTSDAKLAKLRKFVFEGKEYEMWQHLKYGNRPGKQLRIHFAVDNERRRLIVGYIGEHMDNATTRSIH